MGLLQTSGKEDLTSKLIESIEYKKYLSKDISCIDRIYLVYDSIIAKRGSETAIRNAFFWGNYALTAGVSIPYIFKMINLEEKQISGLVSEVQENWFMLQRRINGTTMNFLSGAEKEEATKQFRKEMGMLLDLGIYAEDAFSGENSIFNHEENKIYLLDYDSWCLGTLHELGNMYGRIKNPVIYFSGLVNFENFNIL